MKKILCMLLASILVFALFAACDRKQPAAAVPQEQETTAATGGGLEDSIFEEDPTTGPQQNQTTTKPTKKPDEGNDPTTGAGNDGKLDQESTSLDYEGFRALSPAEQREYQESFETIDAFFEWYNAAYDAYTKANPSIEIGDNGIVTLP